MAEARAAGKDAERREEPRPPAPAGERRAAPGDVAPYLDVPIRISVELGRRAVQVRDLIDLKPGAVIELDKLTGEPVDLVAANYGFAKGEIVVSGEELVTRVSEILPQGEEKS